MASEFAGGRDADPMEHLEDFYEDAPCGYVSYRATDGAILGMNRTLARWLGHGADEWIGARRFQDLLSPPARLAHETRHLTLLRLSGRAGALALEMVRADGARMPVLVSSLLKRVAGDAGDLVRTTVFDGTAHHRYERELIAARERAEHAADDARRAWAAADAANRAKSRFLTAMNHEFRNPINAIAGFSELLADAGTMVTDAERQDYLSAIRSGAAHLVGLLEDATRFCNLDELERSANPAPVRLRRIAGEGLRLAQGVLATRQLGALLDPATEDPEVLASTAAGEALAAVLRDVAMRTAARSHLRIGVRAVEGGGNIELRGPAVARSEQALRASRLPHDSAEVIRRGVEGSGLGLAFAERVLGLTGGSLEPGFAGTGEAGLVLRFVA